MSQSERFDALFLEFPELKSDDVNLHKEVLAHFGLIFSRFALLEASLQNCFVFWRLNEFQRANAGLSQADWEAKHSELETQAIKATLGSLLGLLSNCVALGEHIEGLKALKRKRDYFAHHFFRNENNKMFSDDTKICLILAMDDLRKQVEEMDVKVGSVSTDLFHEVHPDIDIEARVASLIAEQREDFINNPTANVGWDKA